MNRAILIVCVCVPAMCLSHANAAITVYTDEAVFVQATGQPEHSIDFETFGDGTPVGGGPAVAGSEWLSHGIAFTPELPDTYLHLWTSDIYWTAASPIHGLYVHTSEAMWWDGSSYIMTFSTPVRALGFTLCDNEDGYPDEQIVLYGAADQVLGTYPMPYYGSGTGGPEANYFRGFASDTPVARVLIHEYSGDGDGMILDDMIFTVPEPATLSLLTLGALAMLRRRKRGACK